MSGSVLFYSYTSNGIQHEQRADWSSQLTKPSAPIPQPKNYDNENNGTDHQFAPIGTQESRCIAEAGSISPKENAEVRYRTACAIGQYFHCYYLELFGYLRERNLQFQKIKTEESTQQALLGHEKVEAKNQSLIFSLRRHFIRQQKELLRQRRLKPTANDFTKIAQIGQGAYGDVYLVKHRVSKEVYALKVIRKRFLQQAQQKHALLVERDILATTNHPRLVQLRYSFQDSQRLYMAMEYLSGGDFRTFLNSHPPLSLESIQFYFIEMVVSVGSLHDLGYMHRDIKPENFLISNEGRIKLSDFGFACGHLSNQQKMKLKCQFSREISTLSEGAPQTSDLLEDSGLVPTHPIWAKEAAGSPEYMAVEILRGQRYNHTTDFWSLGCILHEMLTGNTPFPDGFQSILNWRYGMSRRPLLPPGYGLSNEERLGGLSFSHIEPPVLPGYRFKNTTVPPAKHAQPVLHLMDLRPWTLLTKLICESSNRYQTALDILSDKFLPQGDKRMELLRKPPFVPQLSSDHDRKYFDDFTLPETQSLYQEITQNRKLIEKRIAMKEKRGLLQHSITQKTNKTYLLFTFKKSSKTMY